MAAKLIVKHYSFVMDTTIPFHVKSSKFASDNYINLPKRHRISGNQQFKINVGVSQNRGTPK